MSEFLEVVFCVVLWCVVAISVLVRCVWILVIFYSGELIKLVDLPNFSQISIYLRFFNLANMTEEVEDLRFYFDMFNINPTIDVLSKCKELCEKYDMCAEHLVDQWFAYTSSVLGGAAPTVQYLREMERRDLMQKNDDRKRPNNNSFTDEFIDTTKTRGISPDRFSNKATFSDVSGTPKRKHVTPSQAKTPLQNKKLIDETLDEISSPSTSSQNYLKRTDARTVRCTFGLSSSNFKRNDVDVIVKPLNEESVKFDHLIMYEGLRAKLCSIHNMIDDLFQAIQHKYESLKQHNEEVYGDNVMLYGRVISEVDAKLNSHSVFLEQTSKFNGRTVSLNLNNIAKYSLFPGQVIVVKGLCMVKSLRREDDRNVKDLVLVKELYADAKVNFPVEPPIVKDNLQLVIACGPFTVEDNLSFEPLKDLLVYVKEQKPHVLLLAGPFYNLTHQGILSVELTSSTRNFFADLIETIMKEIPTKTHVIIVSSQKEPHHFPVYPTPPYEAKEYPNLRLMPDPCMVNVNGLVIGATTADILFDIGSYEIHLDRVSSGPPDRIGRLISHLFNQQSFYPLYPTGKHVFTDFEMMEDFGRMTCKPHILILPSNLRHFVKNVDECLVINPERLTKGNGGGSFARLEISADATQRSICSRSFCEVLKI